MTIPIDFSNRNTETVEEFQLQVESRVQEMQHRYASALDLWSGEVLTVALVLAIENEHRMTELAQSSRNFAEKSERWM